MLHPEDLRLAAAQQMPRKEAYALIAAVRDLKQPELALLWEANNLRPKIDLAYYVKPEKVQSNP